jgi:hypothetical protein
MMRFIAAILLFVLPAFGTAEPHIMNVQHAGYAFDQLDEKGEVGLAEFLREFRSFPWSGEVGRKTGGSEPTISVKNPVSGVHLWVSAIGAPREYAFLVGIVQPRGNERVSWVTAYVLERPEWVEEAFAMYFNGEIQKLNASFARLPVFFEQEAKQW